MDLLEHMIEVKEAVAAQTVLLTTTNDKLDKYVGKAERLEKRVTLIENNHKAGKIVIGLIISLGSVLATLQLVGKLF